MDVTLAATPATCDRRVGHLVEILESIEEGEPDPAGHQA